MSPARYLPFRHTNAEFNLENTYILWHVEPFLGNDRETNNETMTVARQRPGCNNGSIVGSGVSYVVRSEAVSRDLPISVQSVEWSGASWLVSEWVRGLLRLSPCELLLLETGSWGTATVRECRWQPLPDKDWWRHCRLKNLIACCSEL
jgi:hypothetical protein